MDVTQRSELLNVVVLGNMNPAIHRPEWYVSAGIISAESGESALQGDFLFLPPLSQFRANGLAIVCGQERWEVRSDSCDLHDELFRIATTTFRVLAHTPITAVGLNVERQWSTSPAIGPLLAARAAGLDLGFAPDGVGAQITHTSVQDDRRVNCAIKAGTETADDLRIWVNIHRDAGGAMAEQLLTKLAADYDTATSTIATVLEHVRGADR